MKWKYKLRGVKKWWLKKISYKHCIILEILSISGILPPALRGSLKHVFPPFNIFSKKYLKNSIFLVKNISTIFFCWVFGGSITRFYASHTILDDLLFFQSRLFVVAKIQPRDKNKVYTHTLQIKWQIKWHPIFNLYPLSCLNYFCWDVIMA